MLRSILLVSAFSCFLQADVKTGNARVQNQVISLLALPADVQKKAGVEKLCLIMPENNNMATKGKLKYIKAYLVNHTGKTVQVRRADGSLAGMTSEVYQNNQWTLYQQSHPVYCGNSYWSQTLENGKALELHYDYTPDGKNITAFRLKLSTMGESVVSNTINVQM